MHIHCSAIFAPNTWYLLQLSLTICVHHLYLYTCASCSQIISQQILRMETTPNRTEQSSLVIFPTRHHQRAVADGGWCQEEELKKKVGPITKAREVEIAGAPNLSRCEDELNPDSLVEIMPFSLELNLFMTLYDAGLLHFVDGLTQLSYGLYRSKHCSSEETNLCQQSCISYIYIYLCIYIYIYCIYIILYLYIIYIYIIYTYCYRINFALRLHASLSLNLT